MQHSRGFLDNPHDDDAPSVGETSDLAGEPSGEALLHGRQRKAPQRIAFEAYWPRQLIAHRPLNQWMMWYRKQSWDDRGGNNQPHEECLNTHRPSSG